MTFDAWHLPGVEVGELETLETGDLVCRYPVPTPELMVESVHVLREAGQALRNRPVAELVEVIDAAAARLADLTDPLREEAEAGVAAATGFSPAMARLVIDRMSADWRADRLNALLEAELGDPATLDGFRPVGPHRRTRACGPELAFHVFAGNVPGVAVTSLVRALLVKAPSLGKLASGQPVLPVAFARAVHAVDPGLGRALALTYWPGGSLDAEWRALEAADTVIVYGGEGAVASYAGRVDRTRLVAHGPRFSAGLVAREAFAEPAAPAAVAAAVARAVAVFDQHGCVSPHAVWVEEGALSAADFAEELADALAAVEAELPRGRLAPAEASAIQQERAAAELKGHGTETETRVLAGPGTRWTVIYDGEPAFRPSCLNRLVRVHPIATLEEAVDLLAPASRHLQSVAIAGPAERRAALAHRLARVGATRITTFDRLPWPPPEWHHDGRSPLRELLRWVDLESDD